MLKRLIFSVLMVALMLAITGVSSARLLDHGSSATAAKAPDGKSCAKGHALEVRLNLYGLEGGYTNYAKLSRKIVDSKLRFTAKRKTPRVVLCYGAWRKFTACTDCKAYGPWHRFKLGRTKGSITLTKKDNGNLEWTYFKVLLRFR